MIPGAISTGYHFCIYMHVYTLFVPCSSSYPFPHNLTLPTGANPSPAELALSLLFSDFVEEKT
jgi:hypothetical protein